MTASIETIKQEIMALPPAERFDLWRDLGRELALLADDDERDQEVEAAWDAEIDTRVKEIEAGRVELVSAVESLRQVEAMLEQRRSARRRVT